MKIIDPKGEWYMNTSEFQMADPSGVIYPAKELVKITVTKWVKSQAFMVAKPDPTAADAPKPAPVKVQMVGKSSGESGKS